VLVTGGAKGIGRMISEGFVANGARVYISSRDAKACQQACDEMNKLGKCHKLSSSALIQPNLTNS
jgi:NAD(P)-dependent dehydrogenase (short-subunit alcohol dehydrogenase family)